MHKFNNVLCGKLSPNFSKHLHRLVTSVRCINRRTYLPTPKLSFTPTLTYTLFNTYIHLHTHLSTYSISRPPGRAAMNFISTVTLIYFKDSLCSTITERVPLTMQNFRQRFFRAKGRRKIPSTGIFSQIINLSTTGD